MYKGIRIHNLIYYAIQYLADLMMYRSNSLFSLVQFYLYHSVSFLQGWYPKTRDYHILLTPYMILIKLKPMFHSSQSPGHGSPAQVSCFSISSLQGS